jgi:predicted Fe-Mo cluster-binding NifX family protein
MKIAVASPDGATVSSHFGRSACFIVFEMSEGRIVGRETRDNTYTAFAKGECNGQGEHHHVGEAHSHATVVNALRDCQAVLCGGMGRLAAEELQASGVQPVVLDAELTPEAAAMAFATGKLQSAGSFCRCQH